MAMGLSEEQANKVLGLHKDAIKDKFVPKERFDEKNNELKAEKDKVTDRDNQIKDLSKFEGDKTALEAKIKDLTEENKTKETEYNEKLTSERKQNAVKFELLNGENKPHDPSLVLGLLDLTKVNINEDGTIKDGFKEQFETLVKDKGFLFTTAEKDPKSTNNGFFPKGTSPADGRKQGNEAPTSEQFGASLAADKLKQLGVNVEAKKAEAPATV